MQGKIIQRLLNDHLIPDLSNIVMSYLPERDLRQSKKNFADKTYRPDIYKNTYWGNFDFIDSFQTFSQTIITNRNKFIPEYNIIKCPTPPKYITDHLADRLGIRYDHVEYYKTKDNYIIISSPYNYCNHDEAYESRGFKKIYPLYAMNATTYIKIIPIGSKKIITSKNNTSSG